MKARVRYIGGENDWGFVQNAIYDVTDQEHGSRATYSYWIVLNRGVKCESMAFDKDKGEIVPDGPTDKIDDGLFEI